MNIDYGCICPNCESLIPKGEDICPTCGASLAVIKGED